MSNKTRLQTNNANLQTLIDKANNLPDADNCNTIYINTTPPTNTDGTDGDIWIVKEA
jgi:hypothetical protein